MHLSAQSIILLTTFVLSLAVYLQKPVVIYLKFFPVYFFCSFLTEVLTEFLAHQGKYNTGLANAWAIIEFNFYFFVLREIIVSLKIRKVLLFITILYTLLSLLMLYAQKYVGFNPVNFTSGCLITVVFCIYYFIELFQGTESKSLAKLPAFWIVTGILFTNVCTFPMFALISFMKEVPKVISNNLLVIFDIVNVLTSILMSIGFLCRIRVRETV